MSNKRTTLQITVAHLKDINNVLILQLYVILLANANVCCLHVLLDKYIEWKVYTAYKTCLNHSYIQGLIVAIIVGKPKCTI